MVTQPKANQDSLGDRPIAAPGSPQPGSASVQPTTVQPTATTAPKPHPSGDKRFKAIDAAMRRNQYRQDALIEVLHRAQEAFGYLEDDVLIYVARALQLPLSRVFGVATFYHLF